MKSGKQKENGALHHVDGERRDAMRRLVGAGFALPVVLSIGAASLPIRTAHAQSCQFACEAE